jgi:hypothetical protein
LVRNIRNINKKLSSSSKADAVVAENPGVDLDDLVAAKKLNADQKAQILKKPGLQSQLAQLEEQLNTFRSFAEELEEKAAKEKAKLIEQHEAELAGLKDKGTQDSAETTKQAVEDGLRVISHFLHTAASKRQSEEPDTEESRAFEGALLLVYQGNDASLSTLMSLIYGTDEKVPDVNGEPLDFTFAQVKESATQGMQAAVETTQEEVNDTQPTDMGATNDVQTDVTIANAGLTEMDDVAAAQTDNGTDGEALAVPEQASTGADAANAVAESSWDAQASAVTDTTASNEEWVQVPRDPAETDTGVTATPADVHGASSWAEEVGAAAEEKPVVPENDGYEQVRRDKNRGRGRGGRGEFRGRGRGGRGGDGYRGGRGGPKARGGARGDKS